MIRMGPGRKLISIPGIGITVITPGGAAAVNWWNAGGCPNSAWADVWTFKTAADYATAKVGNVNSMALSEGNGAVAWDAAIGMTFNGNTSQKYLDTGLVIAQGWSLIIQFSGAVSGMPAGVRELGIDTRLFIWPVRAGYGRYYGQGDSLLVAGAGTAAGNMCATNQTGYLNGISEGVIGAWSGINTRNLWIGYQNYPNSDWVNHGYQGNIQAIGVANTDISAYVAALASAMGAL